MEPTHVHHWFGITVFTTPLGGLSVSTNPDKAPDIRFSSSQRCKQHPWCEKVVSRTSLVEAIYSWPCESISRGRADSPHSRPYQGIWVHIYSKLETIFRTIRVCHGI
ncbi:unnamed protein product [Schistosoma mattheei]|uniref:Uncharacterized protein n=1 Tax=Schistosoma mattheei TaxID=31246 RepID=A0A3P8FHX1_9TREM|nr:unnamed protein product [Schistosoma mattheei]